MIVRMRSHLPEMACAVCFARGRHAFAWEFNAKGKRELVALCEPHARERLAPGADFPPVAWGLAGSENWLPPEADEVSHRALIERIEGHRRRCAD